jgi:hypothetical protein
VLMFSIVVFLSRFDQTDLARTGGRFGLVLTSTSRGECAVRGMETY